MTDGGEWPIVTSLHQWVGEGRLQGWAWGTKDRRRTDSEPCRLPHRLSRWFGAVHDSRRDESSSPYPPTCAAPASSWMNELPRVSNSVHSMTAGGGREQRLSNPESLASGNSILRRDGSAQQASAGRRWRNTGSATLTTGPSA